MLKGKTVLLGVTGSIAAYKIACLASALVKQHADVHVIMTENATNFINPSTFETLTSNKCLVDTFDRNFQFNVEHVALAKRADIFMVAPASANVIGKIANGIADDMLTTTVMACPCKKIVSPAMNHNMYHNPIVQDNIEKLKHFGYEIITPATGMLANGDIGDGRMPEESVLFEAVVKEIACEKDLAGKKVIVGSGTNQERILLGWNEENKKAGRAPALPVYLHDDASGNLYIQSGRADVFFGPQSVSSWKAALTGKTRVVGLGPKKAYVATTTKKGNELVYALQAALDGAIKRGDYQKVLARWGEQGEAVAQSEVNPPGITY